jgi:hypothetical protein
MKTFLHAVTDHDGFLGHATMRYRWVRYITVANNTHEFWGPLQRSLIKDLCNMELFFDYNDDQDSLRKPGQLRVVIDKFRDPSSQPMLADLDRGNTAYLSRK